MAGEYKGNINEANPLYQTWVLTKRTFLNNLRNIGVFWLRLGMYIALCIMIGTIFFKLGVTWQDTYSFTSLLFFVVAVSCHCQPLPLSISPLSISVTFFSFPLSLNSSSPSCQ